MYTCTYLKVGVRIETGFSFILSTIVGQIELVISVVYCTIGVLFVCMQTHMHTLVQMYSSQSFSPEKYSCILICLLCICTRYIVHVFIVNVCIVLLIGDQGFSECSSSLAEPDICLPAELLQSFPAHRRLAD